MITSDFRPVQHLPYAKAGSVTMAASDSRSEHFSDSTSTAIQCRIRKFRCDSLSFDFRALPCRRTDAKDMNMKMSVVKAVSFVEPA